MHIGIIISLIFVSLLFFLWQYSKGEQIGRTLGFPTANIQLTVNYKLIPKTGVFAVMIHIQGENYKGMLNIGFRPTVEGNSKTIEVNIFDFNKNIYGEEISITLVKRLRDEKKFKNLEALKEQITSDKKKALACFE